MRNIVSFAHHMKRIVVIGAGYAGLATACYLQKAGYAVTIIDKLDIVGGRGGQFTHQGFVFDTGPSWYWMPEVFDNFFSDMERQRENYYHLTRLDPSYRIFWEDNSYWDIPADYESLKSLLEKEEKGAAAAFDDFINEASAKYKISIQQGLVNMTGLHWRELLKPVIFKNALKMDLFGSVHKHIHRKFSNEKIRRLLEFPVLFLGGTAKDIPALYTMMNYADTKLGTWFPEGGMYQVVKAMEDIAIALGVEFMYGKSVSKIIINNKRAVGVEIQDEQVYADAVVSSADYHHTEQCLLEATHRNYNEAYWSKKIFAPSAYLYYIGLNKKLTHVQHHNLFFDADFDEFAKSLYDKPHWSTKPLFYLNCPSVTDTTLAPCGQENVFLLIPLPAGLQGDTEERRTSYLSHAIQRIEQQTGEAVQAHILFSKCFGINDFKNLYNAYKGNAYGLASTLLQTAHFRPKCRNKKVKNLFYTGQLTIPGAGIPPAIIGGKIVAHLVQESFK